MQAVSVLCRWCSGRVVFCPAFVVFGFITVIECFLLDIVAIAM